MVNPGEASISVVTEDKPKMLIGLGQKRHVVRLGGSELLRRR
jgi:hypothetical protein